jgi:hypothetical protein
MFQQYTQKSHRITTGGLAPPSIQLSNQFMVDLKGLYELKPLISEINSKLIKDALT